MVLFLSVAGFKVVAAAAADRPKKKTMQIDIRCYCGSFIEEDEEALFSLLRRCNAM